MPTTVDLSGTSLPLSARLAWDAYNGGRPAHPYQDLMARFSGSVERFGSSPAVVDEQESLDYARLDERSRAVSARLAAEGVRPGDHVALVDERDVGTYVLLLAIVRLNAVFVPLNPAEPAERVAAVLRASRVAWLVAAPGRHTAMVRDAHDTRLLTVDWRTEPAVSLGTPAPVAPEELAYIIHTSGSTGAPKGVRISHRSLSNLVDWVLTDCPIEAGDVVGQMSPLYFDPSVQQIFPAWSAGGCLIPVPLRLLLEPVELIAWMDARSVAHVDLVTPHWMGILTALEALDTPPSLPHMKWLLIGGESMYYEQVARWEAALRTEARIVNIYGPTEATVNASTYPARTDLPRGKIPIGHPLPGYLQYVVDSTGRLCNPYAVGELVIAGVGIAHGYTDPRRTEEVFVTDSTSTVLGLVYRTGDQARLIRDHLGAWVMEFRGRIDDQVKIAGNRVELEEIDVALTRSPLVKDGAVVVDGEGTAKSILCLYIPVPDASPHVERELRGHLMSTLPSYMVPSQFQQVNSLLYKETGKLDREALLRRFHAAATASVRLSTRAPEGDLARAVWQTWSEVLGRDDLTGADDFFTSGGSSLLALEAAARLRRGLDLPVRTLDIYQNPVLDDFVSWATGHERGNTTGGGPWPGTARVLPVATADEALAALDSPAPAAVQDHSVEIVPSATGLAEEYVAAHLVVEDADDETIAGAVADLIALHPILRSTPDATERNLRWIQSPGEVTVPALTVPGVEVEATVRALHNAVTSSGQHSSGRPCHAVIVRSGDAAHLLLWIGHAVCDGESQGFVHHELATCLAARHGNAAWPPPSDQTTHDEYVRAIAARADTIVLERERQRVREFDTARWLFAVSARDEVGVPPRLHRWQVATDASKALAIALHAIAEVFQADALPILVDFHGRIEPYARTLLGSFSVNIPGVLTTANQGVEDIEADLRSFLESLPSRYPGSVRTRPRTTIGAVRISIFQEAGRHPAPGLRVPESIVPEVDGDGHLDVSIRIDDDGVQMIMSAQVELTGVAARIDYALAGSAPNESEHDALPDFHHRPHPGRT